ncbi:MAG TPA: sulfatase-like hydrolase/transferase [Aquihabitans sp.]|jgi:hypothetical protein|nr:sulfatase-like hydrolase/transferase [Aquihabitans sp.]
MADDDWSLARGPDAAGGADLVSSIEDLFEPSDAAPNRAETGGDVPPNAPHDPWAPRRSTEDERRDEKAARARRAAEARRERRARRARVAAAEPIGLRYELRSLLEIAGLCGFAVVQPVLGPFGESPETFVGAGAGAGDIVRFALIVTLVPVLVLAALAALTRALGDPVRRGVQTTLVGVLAGLAAVSLSRQLGAGAALRTVAAVAVGGAFALAHRRWQPGRLFLRYASPTPLLVAGAFLFASPVAPLVLPPDVDPVVAPSDPDGEHADVVVLVFDELPTLSLVDGQGRIDRERFPNIARFADTSTWYRNHSAVAPETLLALPALTTGKMPLGGEDTPYADAESYPDNIFTLLGETHDVHAVEWATDLCPPSVCDDDDVAVDDTARGLVEADLPDRDPTGALVDSARSLWWDEVDPFADEAEETFSFPGSEDSVELAMPALEFLSGLDEAPADRPRFNWLDVGLPHQPWRLLPSGNQYNGPQSPAGTAFLGWPGSATGAELAQATRAAHLLQLQWTDRYLGAVFERLRAIDRFDDALVVFTADHGVAFSPGEPLRDLTPGNATQISYPPLMVKAPGQTQGAVDDGNVISLDLLPTVADHAGVEIPWKVDGESLADGVSRTDPTKVSVALDPSRFAVRGFGDIVRLDVDGLGAILDSPFLPDDAAAGTGEDDLGVYRHGRHGDLLGRRVEDLSVCDGGVGVRYEPPAGWDRWVDGSFDVDGGKVPLHHTGTVEGTSSYDIVLAVDGVVAGWGPSHPDDPGNPFAVLLAEPLAEGAEGVPEVYEATAGGACDLRRVRS